MTTIREAWARLVAFIRKRQFDREFDDEVRSHIAFAIEDYVKQGVPLAEAQRLARVRFGSIESAKDTHRDSRGLPSIESLFYDLRFAIRGLLRDRGFTVAAILMLALAIGLNVTVFTVMDAMLFRGFPLVKKSHRLVYIQERSPSGLMSYADFEDWRSQAHSLEGISFVGEKLVRFRDGAGRPIDTSVFEISANTFGLLGVRPMLGRDFVEADELPGAAPVVILNYRFWDSRFGKRADVIGMTVHVDGTTATIIGVMPVRFDFPTQFDMWMPITRTAQLEQRGVTPGSFLAVGRLRDGASVKEATAELEAIDRQLKAAYPATNRDLALGVVDDMHFHAGPNAPMIYGTLWAGACFVLLIACANLANLTLARTIGRWREFSIRMALGAGQWRMVRQIFMEGVTLASIAGILGWWITKYSVHRWADATASRFQILDYTVDSGTLAYLIAVSIVAAILFSLAPLGRVLQVQVSGVLKGDAGGVTQGLRGKHLSTVLVTGQMALAIVLLSGAGVLAQSFLNVVDARSGVRDPENILVGRMRLPSDEYPNAEKSLGYFDRLETRLRAIPGIKNACVSTAIPVARGSAMRRLFEIEGRPSSPTTAPAVQLLKIGPEYFRVVGVSATAGREFNVGDHSGSLPVAIVNQSFAAAFWPDGTPVGKRLRVLNRNQPGEWLTVVGVVPNIMQGDPIRQKFMPLVYLPFSQEPAAAAQRNAPLLGAYFLLRTEIPPKQVEHAVRIEVQKLDPDVSLEDFRTLKANFAFDGDYMDVDHMELGKDASVAPVFALTALLLAAIGLYAVIAHSVGQRTKEIGVRMAIGATAEGIRRMMLRDGMSPVAVGMVIGLAASLGVNLVLQSQLVGISPYDPVTLTCGPLILIAVALLACHIPARRAMNVDPAVALRNE